MYSSPSVDYQDRPSRSKRIGAAAASILSAIASFVFVTISDPENQAQITASIPEEYAPYAALVFSVISAYFAIWSKKSDHRPMR